MINFFSTGQVSRLLHIPSFKIAYAHSTGLAEPEFRFLGKRCYCEADIRRVASHFRITVSDADIVAAGLEARCNS